MVSHRGRRSEFGNVKGAGAPIQGQPVIKGEKELRSTEDAMRNERQERTNELTDPNSPQSKFQRGEVNDDIHYSAREGQKPEEAPKNIFEQAERDKAARDKKNAEIMRLKQIRHLSEDRKISFEDAEKVWEEQQAANKPKSPAPQSGAGFTGAKPEAGGLDKPEPAKQPTSGLGAKPQGAGPAATESKDKK